jgi:hypothetical protein
MGVGGITTLFQPGFTATLPLSAIKKPGWVPDPLSVYRPMRTLDGAPATKKSSSLTMPAWGKLTRTSQTALDAVPMKPAAGTETRFTQPSKGVCVGVGVGDTVMVPVGVKVEVMVSVADCDEVGVAVSVTVSVGEAVSVAD